MSGAPPYEKRGTALMGYIQGETWLWMSHPRQEPMDIDT